MTSDFEKPVGGSPTQKGDVPSHPPDSTPKTDTSFHSGRTYQTKQSEQATRGTWRGAAERLTAVVLTVWSFIVVIGLFAFDKMREAVSGLGRWTWAHMPSRAGGLPPGVQRVADQAIPGRKRRTKFPSDIRDVEGIRRFIQAGDTLNNAEKTRFVNDAQLYVLAVMERSPPSLPEMADAAKILLEAKELKGLSDEDRTVLQNLLYLLLGGVGESGGESKVAPDEKFKADIADKYNLELKRVPGDGSCLFSSCVEAIKGTGFEVNAEGIPYDAALLRKEIFAHVAQDLPRYEYGLCIQLVDILSEGRAGRYGDALKTLLEGYQAMPQGEKEKVVAALMVAEDPEAEETRRLWVDSYIAAQSTTRGFGGQFEMQVISDLVGMPIRMFQRPTREGNAEFTAFGETGEAYDPKRTLHIVRTESPPHFDAFVPKAGG